MHPSSPLLPGMRVFSFVLFCFLGLYLLMSQFNVASRRCYLRIIDICFTHMYGRWFFVLIGDIERDLVCHIWIDYAISRLILFCFACLVYYYLIGGVRYYLSYIFWDSYSWWMLSPYYFLRTSWFWICYLYYSSLSSCVFMHLNSYLVVVHIFVRSIVGKMFKNHEKLCLWIKMWGIKMWLWWCCVFFDFCVWVGFRALLECLHLVVVRVWFSIFRFYWTNWFRIGEVWFLLQCSPLIWFFH